MRLHIYEFIAQFRVPAKPTTTQSTSVDSQLIEDILKDGLASELDGHVNGIGLGENGSGKEAHQMVLKSDSD